MKHFLLLLCSISLELNQAVLCVAVSFDLMAAGLITVQCWSVNTRWQCGTHWNLAGQREAARALLLVVVVVVGSSPSADGAAS